jgi:hypothetical protein
MNQESRSPFFGYCILLFLLTATVSSVLQLVATRLYGDAPVLLAVYLLAAVLAAAVWLLHGSGKVSLGWTLALVTCFLITLLALKSPVLWYLAGAGVLTACFLHRSEFSKLLGARRSKVLVIGLLGMAAIPLALLSLYSPDLQLDLVNLHALGYGSVHQDTLFHASIASMLADRNIPSTGLHGTPFLHYHFFSHWLIGHAARCLGLSIYSTYCVINSVLIVPLVLVMCLVAGEMMESSSTTLEFLLRVLILIGLVLGFFGYDQGTLFARYKVQADLPSESYNLSIVFLLMIMALLRRPATWKEVILVFGLCLLAIITKVSVGFVCFGFLVLTLMTPNALALKVIPRAVLIGASIATSLVLIKLLSHSPHDPTPEVSQHGWYFQWSGTQVGTFPQPSYLISFTKFLLLQHFDAFLLIALLPVALLSKAIPRNLLQQVFLQATFSLLVGFLAIVYLNNIRTAVGYFIDIARWVSLPYLLIILSRIPITAFRQGTVRNRMVSLSALLCLAVGALSLLGLIHSRHLLSSAFVRLSERAEHFRQHVSPEEARRCCNDYLRQLNAIRKASWTRNLLVYVPASEYRFWTCNVRMTTDALTIPAISERAGLIAIPTEEHLRWNGIHDLSTQHYGFEDYDPYLTKECTRERSEEQLLELSKSLGFQGYIDVRSYGWTPHLVK